MARDTSARADPRRRLRRQSARRVTQRPSTQTKKPLARIPRHPCQPSSLCERAAKPHHHHTTPWPDKAAAAVAALRWRTKGPELSRRQSWSKAANPREWGGGGRLFQGTGRSGGWFRPERRVLPRGKFLSRRWSRGHLLHSGVQGERSRRRRREDCCHRPPIPPPRVATSFVMGELFWFLFGWCPCAAHGSVSAH